MTNDLQEIEKLEAFVEALGIKYRLMVETNMEIRLALEEAMANIIFHANMKGNAYIRLITYCRKNALIFLLTDCGDPFDPTLEDNICVDLPLEERTVGGLGIFLIRALMDEVIYKRIDKENHLILKKKINKIK